jgi:hypothetical protein
MNAQAVMLYRGHEPAEYIGELIFTVEEEERLTNIREDVAAYVRQSTVNFITGEWDVYCDEIWAEYINEYERLGLPMLIRISQNAVDRMR